MKAKELIKLFEGYEDFELKDMSITVLGYSEWGIYFPIKITGIADIGHSDKVLLLDCNATEIENLINSLFEENKVLKDRLDKKNNPQLLTLEQLKQKINKPVWIEYQKRIVDEIDGDIYKTTKDIKEWNVIKEVEDDCITFIDGKMIRFGILNVYEKEKNNEYESE